MRQIRAFYELIAKGIRLLADLFRSGADANHRFLESEPSFDSSPLIPPSRLFRLPLNTQLRKLYTAVVDFGFEIVEQNLGDQEFFFSANSDAAKIDIHGTRRDQHWFVRITWLPTVAQSRETYSQAHFSLAKLTHGLGWKEFWIVEGTAPQRKSRWQKNRAA